MAKRIQMRKNRFLALQKMAEQKKNEAMNASNAAMNDGGGPPDHHGLPKQTVSRRHRKALRRRRRLLRNNIIKNDRNVLAEVRCRLLRFIYIIDPTVLLTSALGKEEVSLFLSSVCRVRVSRVPTVLIMSSLKKIFDFNSISLCRYFILTSKSCFDPGRKSSYFFDRVRK